MLGTRTDDFVVIPAVLWAATAGGWCSDSLLAGFTTRRRLLHDSLHDAFDTAARREARDEGVQDLGRVELLLGTHGGWEVDVGTKQWWMVMRAMCPYFNETAGIWGIFSVWS